MIWNNLIESGIYLVCVYILFWIGKLVYDLTTPSYSMKEELVEKDNTALAVAVVGYYFGLVLAIGGVIVGPSAGLEADLMDILLYGPLAIVLMNMSRVINDKLILHGFSIRDEIIRDQNVGTGVVVCASYIATGLVIYGAVSGVLGGLVTSIVFWILGQLALVLAGRVYNWITPYDIHEQIEKDNVAAGVAFAGALVGIGNIVRHAVEGDFISWAMELQTFGIYVLIGLILLPLIRMATDKILLPGRKLSDEISNQEKPNLGAGFIEAFSYVGASFLLVWVL
jgi:uncharacterized membrane protein YjfL (UPF0719 family)